MKPCGVANIAASLEKEAQYNPAGYHAPECYLVELSAEGKELRAKLETMSDSEFLSIMDSTKPMLFAI